jgi:hypothetical protein
VSFGALITTAFFTAFAFVILEPFVWDDLVAMDSV